VRTIPQQTTSHTTNEGVILGLLCERERSGYDLLKRSEGSVAHMWAPAKSQLYAVLPRLVDDGLASRRTVRQSARPDKQVYRVTRAGRQAVREWLEDALPKSWDELMLKVFFAELCSREALLAQLDDYAEVQRGFLAEYEAITPATRFGAVTLEYGLELMPARLRWIARARRELSR
jgi:PadR family transcriptional regulator, regulatory protein AphA